MSEKKETFTEQTLKQIRSGETSPARRKKRNISRIIMLADILILAVVIIFLNARNSKNEYTTASVNGDGLNARFSVSDEKSAKTYIFTITLLSSADDEKTWNFEQHLATLKLSRSGILFYEDKFGVKISRINMLPGEARIFPLQISSETIDIYLKERTNAVKRKKNLFDLLVKSGEIITAEAVINLQDKLSASISFEHEVDR
ncbi:MAG: hypothetical protein FWG13_05210 [Leptospirales bacterium]|nr:hypothetical protein [Leptospirales bacterium]